MPSIPPFLNSVIKTSELFPSLLLALFEGWLFPVGAGIIITSNILVCITFGGLNCEILCLNAILVNAEKRNEIRKVNRVYESFQLIIDRLTCVFTVSFLIQELA